VDVVPVFEGLRDNASAVDGLRCFEYVPDSIAPPAFFPVEVFTEDISGLVAGFGEFTVRCQVLVSRGSDRSGQKLLKQFLAGAGSGSLLVALLADRSLGGACHDLQLRRIHGYRTYEHQGTQLYGAQVDVLVLGARA
jgi:hypothetical protein